MRLDDTVFAELIRALDAVAGPDEDLRRRQAERYHCVRDVTISLAGVANPVSRTVKLVNISATGVCIIDQMGMSNGNRFVIALPRPAGEPLKVMCTVRQSRLTGAGGFRTGAEFTGEDSDQRLVSGVDGVLAKRPGQDEETKLPARLAIRSGPSAGQVIQATARNVKTETLELHTTVQLSPGTGLIIELHPGRHDRKVLHAIVQDLLALESGHFRVTAAYTVPQPPRKQHTGLFGWFRKPR